MSLVGQTKLEFSKGVATTTELTITYAPSSDVPVEASLSLGKHTFASPILRVALRACEAGEELDWEAGLSSDDEQDGTDAPGTGSGGDTNASTHASSHGPAGPSAATATAASLPRDAPP